MELILYKNEQSKNTVNKVLENGLSVTINLKNDVNLSDIELVLANIDGLENNRFNYFHIVDLNRYYFINRIQSINNSVVKIYGEPDLLMTYKDDLLSSHARLRRNLKTGDYINSEIETSYSTTVSTFTSDVTLPSTHTNILTTIGEKE